MKYRMYVDEVGHASHKRCEREGNRYLSLTGVVLGLDYVREVLAPQLEALKVEFFGSHPDEPVVSHRYELVNRKTPFQCLKDEATCERFDTRLLALLTGLDFQAITVVIDKLEQTRRYGYWLFDPYHYAMQVMLERFVMWLSRGGYRGDVLAESRGGQEDLRLQESFHRVVEHGTDFMGSDQFQGSLTSVQLKLKSKGSNVAGLQVADLIAHPCFNAMLAERGLRDAEPETFAAQLARMVREKKQMRDGRGRVEGWGTKWLP